MFSPEPMVAVWKRKANVFTGEVVTTSPSICCGRETFGSSAESSAAATSRLIRRHSETRRSAAEKLPMDFKGACSASWPFRRADFQSAGVGLNFL